MRRGRVVRTLVNGVKAKLRAAGVTVVMQEAKLDGRDGDCLRVTAGGEIYLGKRLLIASGSTAIVLPIPGVRENLGGFVLTNREVLELTEIPNRLIVVGGGVIGLEMAAYYAMAGAKVTVVEMLDHIAGATDREISTLLQRELEKRGAEFLLKHKCLSVEDGRGRCGSAGWQSDANRGGQAASVHRPAGRFCRTWTGNPWRGSSENGRHYRCDGAHERARRVCRGRCQRPSYAGAHGLS